LKEVHPEARFTQTISDKLSGTISNLASTVISCLKKSTMNAYICVEDAEKREG